MPGRESQTSFAIGDSFTPLPAKTGPIVVNIGDMLDMRDCPWNCIVENLKEILDALWASSVTWPPSSIRPFEVLDRGWLNGEVRLDGRVVGRDPKAKRVAIKGGRKLRSFRRVGSHPPPRTPIPETSTLQPPWHPDPDCAPVLRGWGNRREHGPFQVYKRPCTTQSSPPVIFTQTCSHNTARLFPTQRRC